MSALTRLLSSVLRTGGQVALRELERRSAAPRTTPPTADAGRERPRPAARGGRPRGAGDFTGRSRIEYGPRDDGRPDPGEVVWAWVPFEEGDGRGKDRPVLVVGRVVGGEGGEHGEELLALMMTSRDHDRDAADEARHGRVWIDVGSGAWDRQGRPSEVRVDRVLRVSPRDVRREGAALDRARFEDVARQVRRVHGW